MKLTPALITLATVGFLGTANAQNLFPATGNVGIGTTSPLGTLHLAGTGDMIFNADDGGIDVFSGNDGFCYVDFRGKEHRSDDFVGRIGYLDGDGFLLSAGTGQSGKLSIKENGNVGIGTDAPRSTLHVAGDTILWGGVETKLFIDFHQGASLEDKDFDVRLINDQSGRLTVASAGPGLATFSVLGRVVAQTLELTSDAAQKTGLVPVDPESVLSKVVGLPVSRWSYTNTPAVTHMGPMAQDFQSAFHLGEDAQHIGVVDGIGVSLAAIQGLNAKLEATLASRDAEIAALRHQLSAMQASQIDWERRMANLESHTAKPSLQQASLRR